MSIIYKGLYVFVRFLMVLASGTKTDFKYLILLNNLFYGVLLVSTIFLGHPRFTLFPSS